MNLFAERIVQYKWLIIAIVFLLTVLLGSQISRLHINADIISSLPDDDPAAKLYKEIGTEFGGNNMGIIVLETHEVFRPEVLQHIQQITDSIRYSKGVSTVTSLTNILDIKSTDWGIEIGQLIDEYDMPVEESTLDSLKNYVLANEMYRGTIVSDDSSSTAILFTLLPDEDHQAIAKAIKQKILKMNLPETLYFGGLPIMMNDINDLIISDIVWLIPIVFLVIAGILLVSFKSLRGVLLPLLTAGLAVVWTLGIMSFAGYDLTIISNIIPVVLLAVGSAYTIHVLNSINHINSRDRKEALIKAMAYITIPVILAAVTTAIGFVAFVFGAYLTMIKEFGIFSAVGTLIALFLSIFFVPAIISALSLYKKEDKTENKDRKSVLARTILMPLAKAVIKHPKFTITAWTLFLLVCLTGIFQIETSVNILDYFKEDNPTRVAEDILQKKLGGSSPVFVVFKGDMQSPQVLQLMIATQNFMKEDPYISVTQSVANLIEQMNDAMGEGKKIPDDKAKIEQLWFLLDGQEVMPQLVNSELTKGIVQSKYASINSHDFNTFTVRMNHFIAENQTEDCQIELTGMPSVYVKLNSSLLISQYNSLLIAIVLVILIVGVILRSALKGIIAAIPVVATIIVLFGCMGIAGIPLDIATVLVASIALGIGIDYSIHIITGFNNYLQENGDIEASIGKVILSGGKAVVINVVSVSAGFLVLQFSQIVPLQNFGLLVAISMAGSGFGALTLLPAIFILVNRKKKISVNHHNA